MESEKSCDDADCDKGTVCNFTCACLDKCANDPEQGLHFNQCSDLLVDCFDSAPKVGYEHLKCWDKICSDFYTDVKAHRAQWEGLGGWEMFGGPLAAWAMATPWFVA